MNLTVRAGLGAGGDRRREIFINAQTRTDRMPMMSLLQLPQNLVLRQARRGGAGMPRQNARLQAAAGQIEIQHCGRATPIHRRVHARQWEPAADAGFGCAGPQTVLLPHHSSARVTVTRMACGLASHSRTLAEMQPWRVKLWMRRWSGQERAAGALGLVLGCALVPLRPLAGALSLLQSKAPVLRRCTAVGKGEAGELALGQTTRIWKQCLRRTRT
jgi:hypothetical protein